MIKELYINGVLVDLQDASIPRNYLTPFFVKDSNFLNDSTYTVKIPRTQKNEVLFGLCSREDMTTDIPYIYLHADLYIDGMPIFRNANTSIINISDTIDVQFTWGVDKNLFKSILTTRLNEIKADGLNVIESDWVSNWNVQNMFATGKKYRYLDYVSGIRKSSIQVLPDGTKRPKVQAPSPYIESQKAMTMHPYISYANILDLINQINGFGERGFRMVGNPLQTKISVDTDVTNIVKIGDKLISVNGVAPIEDIFVISVDGFTIEFSQEVYSNYEYMSPIVLNVHTDIFDFSEMKNRLGESGLLLGGKNDEYTQTVNSTWEDWTVYSNTPAFHWANNSVGSYGAIDINETTLIPDQYQLDSAFPLTIRMNFDFEISDETPDITIFESYVDENDNTITNDLFSIGPNLASDRIGFGRAFFSKYATIEEKKGNSYQIKNRIGNQGLNYSYEIKGHIEINIDYTKSLFCTRNTNLYGRYNCLMNLPSMTQMEFIQNMMYISGMFMHRDINGAPKFVSLEDFGQKINDGEINDWSGKISSISKRGYEFNSNSQKNYIKYNNSDDTGFLSFGYLSVDDETIPVESELVKINFNLPDRSSSGMAEFILYEQNVDSDYETTPTITFTNEYTEMDSVSVFNCNGIAYVNNILPNEVSDSKRLDIVATLISGNDISVSDYYEPDILIPEVGNNVVFMDGEVVTDAYIINRVGSVITLNRNVITDANEHLLSFDRHTNGLILNNYSTYAKIINRPIIVSADIELLPFELSNIDITKPVYFSELGKYCAILELNCSDEELSTASFILINQKI